MDRGDGYELSLRAAAVLVREGRVLLCKSEQDRFWTLPGGQAEPGETLADALCRELCEEVGLTVTVERLVWVIENFFHYDDDPCHEIGFYFVVSVEGGEAPEVMRAEGALHGRESDGRRLTFRWFSCAALGEVAVRPSLLADALAGELPGFEHRIHRDPRHRSTDG